MLTARLGNFTRIRENVARRSSRASRMTDRCGAFRGHAQPGACEQSPNGRAAAKGGNMPADPGPALSPEQWSGRDYRQSARELETWAKQKPEQRPEDDATEYVAKLGLSYDDGVIVMNRAHDRVLVPPPARAALAAFALAGQPFGFTHEDVATVRRAADLLPRNETGTALRSLA